MQRQVLTVFHFQRIDRIKSTLSSDLDHLFSSTLASLTEGKDIVRATGTGELDKAKTVADVTECLRTYDMLGLWQDAEEVLRTDVVRSFVKKVCSLFVQPDHHVDAG